jgi:RNase P subunit RPR2
MSYAKDEWRRRMEREMVALLKSVDTVVHGGKAIVSADNSIIIAMVQESLKHGRSATFYVSPEQGQAVMRWYWTPGRVKEIGMEAVSTEERAKIEAELGFKCAGTWFSNRLQCSCGGIYGMFEFMQQGLREHDRDWIKAVLELKNTAVLRVNPGLDAFCPQCHQVFITGHWYEMRMPNGTLSYGCCKGGTILA